MRSGLKWRAARAAYRPPRSRASAKHWLSTDVIRFISFLILRLHGVSEQAFERTEEPICSLHFSQ
jgi:hypothetical protein